MDALPIVPAVALSFGATYYLGKACLMLIVNSLEQPARSRQNRSQHPKMPAHGLPQSLN
jgi:hypothetical protein